MLISNRVFIRIKSLKELDGLIVKCVYVQPTDSCINEGNFDDVMYFQDLDNPTNIYEMSIE